MCFKLAGEVDEKVILSKKWKAVFKDNCEYWIEGDSIFTVDNEEVVGCSEWMRDAPGAFKHIVELHNAWVEEKGGGDMKDKITWTMKYRDGLTDDNVSLHVRGSYEREREFLGTTSSESGELFCVAYRVPDGYMYADEEYKRTHEKPGAYCVLGLYAGFYHRERCHPDWLDGEEYCVPIKSDHAEEIGRLEAEHIDLVKRSDAITGRIAQLRAEMDK